MTDFLLELRSEEIPARMQEKARGELARLFTERLAALNLAHGAVESYATPRRLALIVRDVADATTAATEERKGPRADAPAQAIEGFLRSTGLTRDQLVARDDGKGGQVLFAVIARPGLPAPSVLINACNHVVHAFAWPKSMRWGAASVSTESLRWVRPLQGIVALFGEKIVPFEVAGIASGATTLGHRFHHPGPITIGGANDYVEKLRACHVIVDGAERRGIIALGAKLAAQKAGLALVEDDGLLHENAGLTEWPVPLLGRFDAAFLEVPPEVIQLTARVNQKYFVCRDAEGALANAFVCVANVDAADGGARIVEGNQKVLAARLSDARFFYETDLKVKLDDLRPKLEKIVFHEKLGTVADKVDRITNFALWLVDADIVKPVDGSPQGKTLLFNDVRNAASLAKSDLVTGMVGEFPELQGLIGGYYAIEDGSTDAVGTAIRDHYKPVGQGDDVPIAPVTVAVSLADKLDTLACFFAIDEKPTGSKDPFALRRAAIAVIQQILACGLRANLTRVLLGATFEWYRQTLQKRGEQAYANAYFGLELARGHEPNLAEVSDVAQAQLPSDDEIRGQGHRAVRALLDFFADRLKVQQKEAGVRHDLIDAVFALGGEDDLVRLLARVKALQAFVGTEDGANLLAGYKRAANILKKEGYASSPPHPEREGLGVGSSQESNPPAVGQPTPDPSLPGRGEEISLSYSPEPAEHALIQALDSAAPQAAEAIEREDFEGAMAALAGLRAPIDAFFESVTVNDADPAKREARLALLARMRDAVHRVADFSKIDG
jgi:glycyl-tRNA synthetase beta chain